MTTNKVEYYIVRKRNHVTVATCETSEQAIAKLRNVNPSLQPLYAVHYSPAAIREYQSRMGRRLS